MKPIVIVGAGITGCVIALELAKRDCQIVLIEKEASVGGLAKTFRYGDFSFDIGPHRFFSQKPQIIDFIKAVLGDDYTTMARDSEVYVLGKYYPWPLRPTVLFNFPLMTTIKSSWDLIHMISRNKKRKSDNFEDYILANYGPSLYNVFFKDYTQKFLGLAPKSIHSEWAREGMKRTIIDERIASRNLLDILKLLLIFNPPKTEFIYPIEGIGVFCDRLRDEVKERAGEILLDSAITHIKCRFGKIEEIFLKDISIKPEMVIWTGPLGAICSLLSLPSKGLEYLSILLFNIEMKKPVNKKYQWCYYGSQDIIFGRVSITSSFNKNMAPEHMAGLCVEVTCRQGDRYWNNPELLVERVKNDLIKVGLVNQIKDIGNIHTEKIPDAYPIYTLNYLEDLKNVKGELSKINNLMLAGRTGLFWYNNMDNCVENGLEVAEDILLSNEILKKVEL
jgi:protoporphyrinogen oxidase